MPVTPGTTCSWLDLYCVAIPGRYPRHRQARQHNIMCATQDLDLSRRSHYQTQGWITDDQGHNISDMNHWLGDLTALYWVWKNTDHAWVGMNQYRRFYQDPALAMIQPQDNVLWISDFDRLQWDTWSQFCLHHGQQGLEWLRHEAETHRIDLDPRHVDELRMINVLSVANMFFAGREVFDRLCDRLFAIMLPMLDRYRGEIPEDPYNRRLLAFLSERILTITYIHANRYLPGIDIRPIPITVF